MKMLRALLVGLSLLAAPVLAAGTVQQSGTVTPGHSVMWTTSGVVQDGGSATNGFLTNVGMYSNGGLPMCITASSTPRGSFLPLSSPYTQFCLFANQGGLAGLTLNSYNGAAAGSLSFIINGQSIPYPGPGGGNVIGPVASVDGDAALFSGVGGTILKDAGTPPALIVADTTALQALPTTPIALNTRVRVATHTSSIPAPPVDYFLTSTSCTPDGGSCLSAQGGKFWHITPQTVWDARWWGVDQTGVASATAAINAAAAYVGGLGGGTIVLPDKVLIDGTGVSVTTAGTLLAGVGKFGSGPSTSGTAISCATTTNNCITFGASGDWLSYVDINGTNMTGTSYLVAFDGGTSGSSLYSTGMTEVNGLVGVNGIYLRNLLVHTEFGVRFTGPFSGAAVVKMDGRDGTTSVQDVSFHRGSYTIKGSEANYNTTLGSVFDLDGFVDSVVFEDNFIGFGSKYGIWTENSASVANSPGFIYVYGRGQEDGFGSPIRIDALTNNFMMTGTYINQVGQDATVYVGPNIQAAVFITGSVIRGGGRDGIRAMSGNINVTNSTIDDNGTYANSSFDLAITGAVSSGGNCELTWSSSLPAANDWQPRTGDIVIVAGVGGTSCSGTDMITVVDATHFTMNNTAFTGSYSGGGVTQLQPSNVRLMSGVTQFTMTGGQAGRILNGINRAVWGATVDAGVTGSYFVGVDMCNNTTAAYVNNSTDPNTRMYQIKCAPGNYDGYWASGIPTTVTNSVNVKPFFSNNFVVGHRYLVTSLTASLGTGTSANIQLAVNGTGVGGNITVTTTPTTFPYGSPPIIDGTSSPQAIGYLVNSVVGTPANLLLQYNVVQLN